MAAVALEDQGLYTFFCDEQLHLNITQSRSGKNMMERVVFDGENQVKFCLKVTQDPAVALSVVNHTYQNFVVRDHSQCTDDHSFLYMGIKWPFILLQPVLIIIVFC